MTIRTKDELKDIFKNGEVPNGTNYGDLIDSMGSGSGSGITLPDPTDPTVYYNGEGEWTKPDSGMINPMTTRGDIIYEEGTLADQGNVALYSLGATSDADHSYLGWETTRLLDGDLDTFWVGNNPISDHTVWVKVRLPSETQVYKVRLCPWRSYVDMNWNYVVESMTWEIWSSLNDVDYTQIGSRTLVGEEYVSSNPYIYFDVDISDVQARYIKIYATAHRTDQPWYVRGVEVWGRVLGTLYPERLPIGAEGDTLSVVDGIPSWTSGITGPKGDKGDRGDPGPPGSGGGTSSYTREDLTSQVDGSNVDFLTTYPFIEGSIIVYLNGLLQSLDNDYEESSLDGKITFLNPPLTSGFTDRILVLYIPS